MGVVAISISGKIGKTQFYYDFMNKADRGNYANRN
jgi:hypothetical protein